MNFYYVFTKRIFFIDDVQRVNVLFFEADRAVSRRRGSEASAVLLFHYF